MENTVLILGAGFSKPYGYPTGPELVDWIIKNYTGSKNSEYRAIASDLKKGGYYSIDKFLFENSKYSDAGAQLILLAIFDAEIESLNYEVKPDLDVIKLILDQVSEENFKHLRIISFNYDRLLEWKLLNKLKIKLGSEELAQHAFSKIKIKHVHERMPLLDELEKKSSGELAYLYACEDQNSIYRQQCRMRLLATSNKYKTIYTNSKEPDEDAVAAIKWAKRVFFLGFAYDNLNMAKLGINNPSIIYDWTAKFVAGTNFGMKGVQRNRIYNVYDFLSKRLFPMSCLDFFQDGFDLVNSRNDEIKSTVKEKSCCQMYAFQERPQNDLAYFHQQHICEICDKLLSVTYHKPNTHVSWKIEVREHPEWERNTLTISHPRKVFT